MRLKLIVFCPDDKDVIARIIKAASESGAGIIGKYTENAFITKGTGHWRTPIDGNPHIGTPGEETYADEVKIEMECDKKDAKNISEAIKNVHPYETVAIDFVQLVDIDE